MQKLKSKKKLLKIIYGIYFVVVPIPKHLYHLSVILDELAATKDYQASNAFEDAYAYLMAEYSNTGIKELNLSDDGISYNYIAVCRKITSAETAEKIVEKIELQKL